MRTKDPINSIQTVYFSTVNPYFRQKSRNLPCLLHFVGLSIHRVHSVHRTHPVRTPPSSHPQTHRGARPCAPATEVWTSLTYICKYIFVIGNMMLLERFREGGRLVRPDPRSAVCAGRAFVSVSPGREPLFRITNRSFSTKKSPNAAFPMLPHTKIRLSAVPVC